MGFSLGGLLSDIGGAAAGIGTGILTANPLLGLGVGESVMGLGNSLFGNQKSPNYQPSYQGNPYGSQAGALGLSNLQQFQGGGVTAGQQAGINNALQENNAATNNAFANAGLGASSMLTSALGQNTEQSQALTAQINQTDIQNALGELGMAQYGQGNNAPLLSYNLAQQNQQNSAFGSLFGALGQLEGMGGFNNLNQTVSQDANATIPTIPDYNTSLTGGLYE